MPEQRTFVLDIMDEQTGKTVAQTHIFASNEQDLAEALVNAAEDFQNGDSDWLKGAFDD